MYFPEVGVSRESDTFFPMVSNIARSMFFYTDRVGHFWCDKDYTVKRDSFEDFIVMYVINGSGYVRNGSKTVGLKAGDTAVMGCLPHCYTTDGGSWETIWFHFNGCSSRQYFDLLYERANCVIDTSNSLIIPKYMNNIFNIFKNNEVMNEPLISCMIQRVLAELVILSSNIYGKHEDESNPVMDAIAFMESNFRRKIGLEEIAVKANLSIYYFTRSFKKETGYTPYEYIIKLRINHAKKLLKSTNYSIKEIAKDIGFGSESNFIHTFRTHTHITPVEFRRQP